MEPMAPKFQRIAFERFEVDLRSGELRKNGRKIRLQPQPFQLLVLLLERPGEMVTREEICHKLWKTDTFVDFDHSLGTAINKIREALGDSAEQPRFVETLPRRGYRFIGEINENGNGTAPAIFAEPPVVSVPEAPQSRPLPEASRKPKFSMKTFAIVMAACSALTVLWLLRPSLPIPRITDTVQLTSDGRDKFGTIATDGLRVYFSERVADHWILAAVPVSGGETVFIHTPFQDVSVLNISPDRSQLLLGEGPLIEDHPLWRVPVLGGSPRRLGNLIAHAASWSPDGRSLAYAKGGDLYLANADGTEPHKLLPSNPDPSVWAWSPTWSTDGTRLRFEYYELRKHGSTMWEVTADGRNLHMVLAASNNVGMQCCGKWTADEKYYLFDSWKGVESGIPWPAPNIWGIREARSFLHKTSHEPFQLTSGPIHFFDQVLSPDGHVIYATSVLKHGELMRYDVKTQQLVPYLSGVSVEGVTFSADGAWIAYVKFPQGELWRSRIDGSEPLQLTTRPLVTYSPHWSPDSKQIAFSGQIPGEDWQLYVVSADGGTPRPLPQSNMGMDPSWSPDGASLLFSISDVSGNSKIQLMNLNKRQVSDFPGSLGLIAPKWSPNGQYIAALSEPAGKLVLFDSKAGRWSDWVTTGDMGWPNWSRDGQSVYFVCFGTNPGVFRVALNEQNPRKILSLDGFRFTGAMGAWFSLTPDNEPLLLRDIGGGTEIYALHWDAH